MPCSQGLVHRSWLSETACASILGRCFAFWGGFPCFLVCMCFSFLVYFLVEHTVQGIVGRLFERGCVSPESRCFYRPPFLFITPTQHLLRYTPFPSVAPCVIEKVPEGINVWNLSCLKMSLFSSWLMACLDKELYVGNNLPSTFWRHSSLVFSLPMLPWSVEQFCCINPCIRPVVDVNFKALDVYGISSLAPIFWKFDEVTWCGWFVYCVLHGLGPFNLGTYVLSLGNILRLLYSPYVLSVL